MSSKIKKENVEFPLFVFWFWLTFWFWLKKAHRKNPWAKKTVLFV